MKRTLAAKTESNRAIVIAAARLFRERGVERTSVADVMRKAGLTHGGFYRHFRSKGELVAAAVDEAFRELIARLGAGATTRSTADVVARFVDLYLSEHHVEHAADGCPIVALGSEASREGDGGDVQRAFAAGVERLLGEMAGGYGGSGHEARRRAASALSAMVGAVLVSRAVGGGRLGAELRAASKVTARRRRKAGPKVP